MTDGIQIDIHSKRFVWRLATMIQSELICYKHYYPWADELILELHQPPAWLLQLALTKHYRHAAELLQTYVNSPPFEEMPSVQCSDEFVACLFLRYLSREISLATFFSDAGMWTDSNGGSFCCEYFYEQLNKLEDCEYSIEVEQRLCLEIEDTFADAHATISPFYEYFRAYFREYVRLQMLEDNSQSR